MGIKIRDDAKDILLSIFLLMVFLGGMFALINYFGETTVKANQRIATESCESACEKFIYSFWKIQRNTDCDHNYECWCVKPVNEPICVGCV